MRTTITALEDERAQVAAAVEVLRVPGARVGPGDGIAVPPALRALLEAAAPALAGAVPVDVVTAEDEVSPAEAARMLGVTRQYVDRLVARGALPARRLPDSRYRRIPLSAVLARLAPQAPAEHAADEQPEAPARREPWSATDDDGVLPALPAQARTGRGQERRELLIAATARLVAERGFHAVRISEIGAAAGVSGAAIYRHFANKTELLVAVFDQVVSELLEGSARILAAVPEREPALEQLVRHHVRLVLRNPAVFGVYVQELHNLPADDRSRLRRGQREYVLRFAVVLEELLPGDGGDGREARTRVQAVFGLLNALANFPSPVPGPQLADLLTGMALAAMSASPSTSRITIP